MALEDSLLYRSAFIDRAQEFPEPDAERLARAFADLRERIAMESEYIKLVFPEYTPHDEPHHLTHLFTLADSVLGSDVYNRLTVAELAVLAFALLGHDWGMAVSDAERLAIGDATAPPGAPSSIPIPWYEFLAGEKRLGRTEAESWPNYVRITHAARSADRLRTALTPVGESFAYAVSKAALAHGIDSRDIRDQSQYPPGFGLFNMTVNLPAVSLYVRILDLLDIADNRTPYQLWKYVAPTDAVSADEWKKHLAIGSVFPEESHGHRRLVVTGVVHDERIYAQLLDLRRWVNDQFAEDVASLSALHARCHTDLDSTIEWRIVAEGFLPLAVSFEPDRASVLELLGAEIYEGERLAFVRELLQNAVDAIDTRVSLHKSGQDPITGRIRVDIDSPDGGLVVRVSDNGIGMDEDTVRWYLARIGKSWYTSAQFVRTGLVESPISRFGVGLLSCFTLGNRVVISTLRDQMLTGTKSALRIEIPNKLATFRIAPDLDRNEPGTSVSVHIDPAKANLGTGPQHDKVTGRSIFDYIVATCKFVEHDLRVTMDGDEYRILPVSMNPKEGDPFTLAPSGELRLRSDNADEQRSLDENVRVVTRRLSDEDLSFSGFYSFALPVDLESVSIQDHYVHFASDKSNWVPRSFGDQGKVSLSVKGLAAGVWDGNRYERALTREDWFSPSLLVNVTNPRLIAPNLARNRVRTVDERLPQAILQQISDLAKEAITSPLSGPKDALSVLALGQTFAGVPDDLLLKWVSGWDWPVLLLQGETGVTWGDLSGWRGAERILEAPWELGFCKAIRSRTDLQRLGLTNWKGEVALVPSLWTESDCIRPWEERIRARVAPVLISLGYQITEVAMSTSPRGDRLPLFSRVWTKDQVDDLPLIYTSRTAAARSPIPALPMMVKFPDEIANYAGIGSLFWNRNHPKIEAISSRLVELFEAAFGDARAVIRPRVTSVLAASRRSYEYHVAARYSSHAHAIDFPSELLKLASELLPPRQIDPLTIDDFLPGSVERYRNPLAYDLGSWDPRRAGSAPVGRALSDWP